MKKILILFLLSITFAYGQKIKYTVDGNGVHIEGVTTSNSVIYDNDIVHDSPDLHYLWLRANRGEVKLVGNIATRDMHPQGESRAKHWPRWVEFYDKAIAAGLKNIPRPIQGAGGTGAAGQHLAKPASGNIDETVFQNNAGSDLIISEAHKASAAKPLVIFVGGNVSTVANAYLKDKSIVDKVVVLHYAGYVTPGGTYNTMDKWSTYVVMKRMKYVVVSGDQYTYYNGQKPVPTTVNLSGMPANPFTKTLTDNWVGQYYATYKEAADSPPVLWFFRNSLFKNVVRKLENGQTTTSNTFDFLLVSQYDWPWLKSNAWLDYIRNPANHVPGGVIVPPPVNESPTVTTTMGALFNAGPVTLTASASDSDGSVSKVEFLVNGSKVGEDTSSPYSLVQTFVPGSYGIQAKAIDNLGAVGNSPTLIITVVGPTEPPDSTDCIVCPAGPQGAKGDKGDPGEPGVCPNCPPSGGGSEGPWKYSYARYGARGDGSTDDYAAIQKCFNDAAAAQSKVIAETPAVGYVITKQIVVKPASGQQIFLDFEAFGGTANQHIYKGPSNSSAFLLLGIKSASWKGLNVSIAGQSNVACLDLTTKNAQPSLSDVIFESMRFNLGSGSNVYGVRIGWGEDPAPGNGADISILHFEGIRVTGGGGSGQIGFLNVGRNTIANNWTACFVSGCDVAVANVAFINGVKYRGNGGMFFEGLHTSGNKTMAHFDFEANYSFTGCQFELDGTMLKTEPAGHNINVVFLACEMTKVKNNVAFEVNAGANLTIIGCRIIKDQDNAGFDDLVRVNLNSGWFASVTLQGNSTIAKNLIGGTGGSVAKFARANMRYENYTGVKNVGIYPDIN